MPNSVDLLATSAISAALSKNWKEAITLNKQIIDYDNQNISALNRLAKAYLELEMYDEAKKTLRQVLKLEPINQTALKNMEFAKAKKKVLGSLPQPDIKNFIKEPGTSREFSLSILTKGLTAKKFYLGESLNVKVEGHRVCLYKSTDEFVSVFDSNTADKIIKSIKNGGNVKAAFLNGDEKEITVLIKSSIPIFKTEKQELKPYVKRETIEEPELELGTVEEESL